MAQGKKNDHNIKIIDIKSGDSFYKVEMWNVAMTILYTQAQSSSSSSYPSFQQRKRKHRNLTPSLISLTYSNQKRTHLSGAEINPQVGSNR